MSTMLCELSECQLAVDTSPLTEPVNCVIEDTCTGVRCCAEVGFLQRSFEVHLSLDPCTQTIQVSIERLNFNVSLNTITMGKGRQLHQRESIHSDLGFVILLHYFHVFDFDF